MSQSGVELRLSVEPGSFPGGAQPIEDPAVTTSWTMPARPPSPGPPWSCWAVPPLRVTCSRSPTTAGASPGGPGPDHGAFLHGRQVPGQGPGRRRPGGWLCASESPAPTAHSCGLKAGWAQAPPYPSFWEGRAVKKTTVLTALLAVLAVTAGLLWPGRVLARRERRLYGQIVTGAAAVSAFERGETTLAQRIAVLGSINNTVPAMDFSAGAQLYDDEYTLRRRFVRELRQMGKFLCACLYPGSLAGGNGDGHSRNFTKYRLLPLRCGPLIREKPFWWALCRI